MSSTSSDDIPDSLLQRLKEEYEDDPVEWALDISKLFQRIAADMKQFAQGYEAPDSPLRSFHRVAHLLKKLSTDHAMIDELRGVANISSRRDEEASASASPPSPASPASPPSPDSASFGPLSEADTAEVHDDDANHSVPDDVHPTTWQQLSTQTSSPFTFEAKTGFSILVTENPPVSAVDNMTLGGSGPATIKIFVSKTVVPQDDTSVVSSSNGSHNNNNVPVGFGPEPENRPFFSLFDDLE
ncbi:hypothetical protein B0T20DRAFT_397830 [Sordaria brevicollis]|uniref:Uncharacterized protein n=1 Tax=Sordaria brevicollis TaxID=83679 RepID=A0AAE0NV78_SORBR|nr:hypothetical protein B0T20DRAFT_397830 [Sordaria brevicollis]